VRLRALTTAGLLVRKLLLELCEVLSIFFKLVCQFILCKLCVVSFLCDACFLLVLLFNLSRKDLPPLADQFCNLCEGEGLSFQFISHFCFFGEMLWSVVILFSKLDTAVPSCGHSLLANIT